jgi:Zn-finger nucleic acid-binding protein
MAWATEGRVTITGQVSGGETTETCPGCSGTLRPVVEATVACYRCNRCSGVIAFNLTEYEAFQVVRAGWAPNPNMIRPEDQYYFDITYRTASGKQERRHGWFDPLTRLILQTG